MNGSHPTRPRRRVLALDIGGTKLATAVMDAEGELTGLQVEPTHREQGPGVIVARLFDLARRSLNESGAGESSQVEAVGLSCGGPLDARSGTLLGPPHLPGWDRVELGELTATEFGLPWALENDATAAALGQYWFGAGRDCSTMLYLTLSTGIGGGAVIDGRLHRGAAGNGGELGHILVQSGGRLCTSCGRRGCLEAYCSGTNIAQRAREALLDRPDSSLASLDTITAAEVSSHAAAGDQMAGDIWHETTALLGSALTDLTNVFEPELIVLGGGVTNAGDLLLEPVQQMVARDAMPPAARACRVTIADRRNLAGILGAGAIALEAVGADCSTPPGAIRQLP